MRRIFLRMMHNAACAFALTACLLVVPVTRASAANLIDCVQEKYQKTDSFRANFVQKTHVEVLDRDVEEKGELLFSKPGRFSILYQGSNERHYLSDGKTLWIYHPQDKEVEVIQNVRDLVAKEALVFLGGLGEMTKEFRVKESGDDRLTLVPKSKTSSLSKVILKIDLETSLVREADLFPKSGNQSHYSFTETKVNEKVSSGDFVFSKKGVKEIRPLSSEE